MRPPPCARRRRRAFPGAWPAGALMLERLGPAGIDALRGHASDTVRLGLLHGGRDAGPGPGSAAAPDPGWRTAHFGVREWVWMALRPGLAAELRRSVALLTPWTREPSERLRRFASESLRPRGVWCAHIAELKAIRDRFACRAVARRSLGICAGLGGQLAERRQQGPAGLGARRMRALAGRRAGRGHTCGSAGARCARSALEVGATVAWPALRPRIARLRVCGR